MILYLLKKEGKNEKPSLTYTHVYEVIENEETTGSSVGRERIVSISCFRSRARRPPPSLTKPAPASRAAAHRRGPRMPPNWSRRGERSRRLGASCVRLARALSAADHARPPDLTRCRQHLAGPVAGPRCRQTSRAGRSNHPMQGEAGRSGELSCSTAPG